VEGGGGDEWWVYGIVACGGAGQSGAVRCSAVSDAEEWLQENMIVGVWGGFALDDAPFQIVLTLKSVNHL